MNWEGMRHVDEHAQRMRSDFGDRVRWPFSINASCFMVTNIPCLIACITDGRLFG